MPVDPNAAACVTAYSWVPPFARGLVRDLRVRWVLEEAGMDYAVDLRDPRGERDADWLDEQPFGQVPVFRDEDVHLFESGAIVLHIAGKSDALMPADPQGRGRAATWVIAALNTMEPLIQQLAARDAFPDNAPWACAPREGIVEAMQRKLGMLEAALGDRDWLEGRFTVGDLMMVTVLRLLRDKPEFAAYPKLAAYVARGEARPAFQRALAAQMADFADEPVGAA